MTNVLVFALTLLAAVLLSGLAERTVLSTAALFLVAGFIIGSVGLVGLRPENPLVGRLAELALFAVPFTDGAADALSHGPARPDGGAPQRLSRGGLLPGFPVEGRAFLPGSNERPLGHPTREIQLLRAFDGLPPTRGFSGP